MVLRAVKSIEDADRDTLRWRFYIASAKDMRTLGAAFGRAMLPRQYPSFLGIGLAALPDETFRVGLCSDNRRGMGKSTFTKGLLETVEGKSSLEQGKGGQNVWFSPQAGWIRHYECNYVFGKLPSYYQDDKSKFSTPMTDIVGHPYHDGNDKEFHCLVFFDRPYKGERFKARRVTVEAGPELAQSAKFQDFLKESARLLEKPESGDGKNSRPLPAAAPI